MTDATAPAGVVRVVGVAIIVFNIVIPPPVGLAMEFAVALMLIALGILVGVLERSHVSAGKPQQSCRLGELVVQALGVFRRRQLVALAGDHQRGDREPRDRGVQVQTRERAADGAADVRAAVDDQFLAEPDLGGCGIRGQGHVLHDAMGEGGRAGGVVGSLAVGVDEEVEREGLAG